MRKIKRLIAWALTCVLFLTTGNSHVFAASLEGMNQTKNPLINYLTIDQPFLTAPGRWL